MAKKEEKEKVKKSALEELRDYLTEKSKGVHISILSQSDIANINEWVLGPSTFIYIGSLHFPEIY